MIKQTIKEYLPYKYMHERHEKQKSGMLGYQEEPLVYNAKGEVKRVFYLSDTLSQHTPYTFILGQNPEYILWDRNNVGLPIHFYTHEKMFQKHSNNYKKKFGLLFESELIRPNDFSDALQKKEKIKTFDKVFTFSERILNEYDNALFAPASGLWYGTQINGGEWDELRYLKKSKNISVIASNKTCTEYHRLRIKLANEAMNTGKVDAFGNFCGNRIDKKSSALDDYRYTIVVENDVKPYYFTEKILDCFASMTIPIYVGATKLNEFFNMDGVIEMKPEQYDHIDDVIKQCSEIDYESRKCAILDNYQRVKKYRCIEDYLIENYGFCF